MTTPANPTEQATKSAPLSVEEIPCAFFPNERKRRLDPFELTDMWRRAQEQLKQPWLEMLKRLIAEHLFDYRRAEDYKSAYTAQASEIERLKARIAWLEDFSAVKTRTITDKDARIAELEADFNSAADIIGRSLAVVVEFGNLNGFRNLSNDELGRLVVATATEAGDFLNRVRPVTPEQAAAVKAVRASLGVVGDADNKGEVR